MGCSTGFVSFQADWRPVRWVQRCGEVPGPPLAISPARGTIELGAVVG